MGRGKLGDLANAVRLIRVDFPQRSMKVIVTGSTGLVGSALVRECIANDHITHVFALSRRPLDRVQSFKLTVILHADFSVYQPELIARLAGAEGLPSCFRSIDKLNTAIGGRANQFPDLDTYKRVQVDYALAAATVFRDQLAPQLPEGKQFRFVLCSGKFAEWDQSQGMYSGQVEQGLCGIADADTTERLVAYFARPSGILPADAGLAARLSGRLYGAPFGWTIWQRPPRGFLSRTSKSESLRMRPFFRSDWVSTVSCVLE
ncbi:hypothetical protein N658DRAFT_488152 [Parathielavia hyrcaniae]|uniref:Uncharacterized protein n=1 Tax=Parathielavia hyrcaniae TaxID=113614 RepID=A0AAN6PX97_9PEZI|nr:hypothetical protein N658DRAFT_488152 [Parathielavia hyrcaniae]